MRSKLILGTAGLSGARYGRNGRCVTSEQAMTIICEAMDCGIDTFDTSPAYGDVERILSGVLRGRGRVFTKCPIEGEPDYIAQRIGAEVTHVLLHNWRPRWYHRLLSPHLPRGFEGVSTYSHDLPAHLRYDHNYVQVDWNLLRQTRFTNRFGMLTTVIARSVLLQGVLADGPIPLALRAGVERAARAASAYNVSLPAFALRAAIEHPQIEAVVIGPTTVEELHASVNIAAWKDIGTQAVLEDLDLGLSPWTDARTFG